MNEEILAHGGEGGAVVQKKNGVRRVNLAHKKLSVRRREFLHQNINPLGPVLMGSVFVAAANCLLG